MIVSLGCFEFGILEFGSYFWGFRWEWIGGKESVIVLGSKGYGIKV